MSRAKQGEPIDAARSPGGVESTDAVPSRIPPSPRGTASANTATTSAGTGAGASTTPASGEPKAGTAPSRPIEETRGRKRWARRLKFTREGKYFLGITLGVGLAAINTGNNPLYLLLGMMLSLIIVSGVMSELSLRTLAVRRRLPQRAQVGRSHLVEIEVWNDKEQVPSYAIEVEDLRAGQPADKRCFFLKISPRSTQVAAYRRTPQRRGLEHHTGFRVATRFPFGLFEKSREVDASEELIVYPAVDPVRLPRRGQGKASGDLDLVGRGQGEEFYSVRPMRDGDDPRDIYWRKSTVPGQRVLRERARELRHDVELRLDDHRHEEATHARSDEDFERRVREMASLAVAHVRRGDRVTIITASGRRVAGAPSRGIDPLLRFLALIEQVHPQESEATDDGRAARPETAA
jgi:uncharacterized protein (DUF58 family)